MRNGSGWLPPSFVWAFGVVSIRMCRLIERAPRQLRTIRRMSEREIVHTDDAPAAIGPYSQAVKAKGFVFCSGQIPLDPRTGKLIGGDVKDQTKLAMENLGAVLRASGSGWERVVKVTIFLAEMTDFGAVNEVYATYFEGIDPPARACVAAKQLPKDVDVEIECVALCD